MAAPPFEPHDREVKLVRSRPNVLTLTLTSQELATLMAAARLSLDAVQADPRAPAAAFGALEQVVREYDRAAARLENGTGAP